MLKAHCDRIEKRVYEKLAKLNFGERLILFQLDNFGDLYSQAKKEIETYTYYREKSEFYRENRELIDYNFSISDKSMGYMEFCYNEWLTLYRLRRIDLGTDVPPLLGKE